MVVRAAEDYYDTLGVSKTADKKEIKSAYRQKARSAARSRPGHKGGTVMSVCIWSMSVRRPST